MQLFLKLLSGIANSVDPIRLLFQHLQDMAWCKNKSSLNYEGTSKSSRPLLEKFDIADLFWHITFIQGPTTLSTKSDVSAVFMYIQMIQFCYIQGMLMVGSLQKGQTIN